jgi:ribonuclease HI
MLDNIIIVHSDGAARGNPGPAAIAFVISGLESQVVELAQKIGSTTNNQAEYQAISAALKALTEKNITSQSIECYLDSELVVRQINGQYRVKDLGLKVRFDELNGLIKTLENSGNDLKFVSIPREKNKRADELANFALDH